MNDTVRLLSEIGIPKGDILSERGESQVAQMIRRGKSTREIASSLRNQGIRPDNTNINALVRKAANDNAEAARRNRETAEINNKAAKANARLKNFQATLARGQASAARQGKLGTEPDIAIGSQPSAAPLPLTPTPQAKGFLLAFEERVDARLNIEDTPQIENIKNNSVPKDRGS